MPLLMCPNDDAPMQTLERSGVQFDMCPKCRGVWLDRGELDKILARAAAETAPAVPSDAGRGRAVTAAPRDDRVHADYARHDDRPGDRRYDHDDDDHRPRRKRRESFLSDLFDF